MFSLPQDIFERSKSTQIQWGILILLQTTFIMFILTAGFQFIFAYVGMAELSMEAVLDSFVIVMSIAAVIAFFKIRRIFKEIQTLKAIKETGILDEILGDIRGKALASLEYDKETAIADVVPINFKGQHRLVAVIANIGEEAKTLTDEDKEEIIEGILQKHFRGLVIEADVERKIEPEG